MKLSAHPPQISPRGFTLLELITVMAIVAVLAALLFPAIRDLAQKPEAIRCMSNLRSLHVSFSAYVADHKEWPQIPEGVTLPGQQAAFWLNSLLPYGAPVEVWRCPGVMREIKVGTLKDNEVPEMHYMPTQFSAGQFTPYRWSGQPWLVEMYDHGNGALIIFPDGSIKTFNELYEAATGKKID